MYLKKLELQGFKSFANSTALEFQRGICAVVGPNGSGKSNIADALRFVLGEQSMKNIRSKKGEDLIFSGSVSKARTSMASAAIHFDNTDKAFPLDFETVIIKRKIFRDGENQYFINNAQVRLKDIAELIAKARLGLRGYTVINQGMGDVILSASPKERKEIIFDALGLREFQIKKHDASIKLAQTKTNTEKAQTVLAELTPHLRFLKKQVEKMEEREVLRDKLAKMESNFLRKKMTAVESALGKLLGDINSGKDIIEKTKRELGEANNALDEENKKIMQSFADVPRLEDSLIKVESERNGIEREVGKIEGMIAFARSVPPVRSPVYQPVDLAFVEEKLGGLSALLDDILKQTDLNILSEKLKNFSARFSEVFGFIRQRKIPVSPEVVPATPAPDSSEYEEKRKSLLALLAVSDQKLKSIKEEIRNINMAHGKERERVFELKNTRRELEIELAGVEERMAAFERDKERFSRDKFALEVEKSRLGGDDFFSQPIDDELFSAADDEIIRDIERMKLKLENIDLIDQSAKTEYEEAQKRHDFLSKELGDLEAAIVSLKEVIAELDELISEKFKTAFDTINKNFNDYFNTLFDGGRAKLELAEDRPDQEGEEETGAEENKSVGREDYGIEMEVFLPRKKATGLAMLSGGERALASLALIFALVSTSPPPFLVLDEIDAPLDEANSLRFGKIIGELKDRTQFIVITHNRETMRQSDALFGVTMQEDGVSKLLSLKFDESLQYAS